MMVPLWKNEETEYLKTKGWHNMTRILVVDDEKSTRITLQKILMEGGYEVGVAEDTDSAITKMEGNDYDVVLTDIVLPKISGNPLLKWIKERSPSLKVILMTWRSKVNTASRDEWEGAFACLVKPVDMEHLFLTISQAVKVKTLEAECHRLEKVNRQYQGNLEKLEARLQRPQRPESVTTLVGEVAHDFNNILYSIVGFTELTIEDVPEDSPVRDNLNEIMNGVKRAQGLVQQLLTFSHKLQTEKNNASLA